MASHAVNVVVKARDEASKKFGRVGKAAGGMGRMLKTAVAAAGMYIGARAIKNFVGSSISAFAKQEMAAKHLKDALELLDKAHEMPQMREFAAELQRLTMVGDETTLELMSMASAMGKLSGDTLKAATVAAMGLSKAYKMDLEGAMRLVARAAAGDTTTLARYGIKLEEGMTTGEKFAKVLAIGASKFKLVEGEIETNIGMMEQLKNTWGDFKEMIGDAITGYLPNLIVNFKGVQVAIEKLGLVMDILSAQAALTIAKIYEDMKHFFGTVIPDLLSWFGRNWRAVFTDMYHFTMTVVDNMATNMVDFFKAVWSWLKGEEFDFKWTGLLEGFESTLEEMPKIVKRELSEMEKALGGQLEELGTQFSEKLIEKLEVKSLDTKKLLENVVLPDLKETVKLAKIVKVKQGGWSAEPVRLRSFFPGGRLDAFSRETARNTKQMVDLQGKILGLFEQIERSNPQTRLLLNANFH